MRNDYLRNPHEFDRWLKANAVLGSLLAIGMLAMALAALKPAARPDGATELSTILERAASALDVAFNQR